jgi:hypothetical protein
MGSNAGKSSESQPTFQRDMLPSSIKNTGSNALGGLEASFRPPASLEVA